MFNSIIRPQASNLSLAITSDPLLVAMAMAAFSTLGIIAYRHPKGFARIYPGLMVVMFGCLLLWWAGSIGYAVGFSEASVSYLRLNPGNLKSPERESEPFWVWMFLAAFIVYVQILRALPRLLGLSSEPSPKKQRGVKGGKKAGEINPDT